jgi:hypothetical protein
MVIGNYTYLIGKLKREMGMKVITGMIGKFNPGGYIE